MAILLCLDMICSLQLQIIFVLKVVGNWQKCNLHGKVGEGPTFPMAIPSMFTHLMQISNSSPSELCHYKSPWKRCWSEETSKGAEYQLPNHGSSLFPGNSRCFVWHIQKHYFANLSCTHTHTYAQKVSTIFTQLDIRSASSCTYLNMHLLLKTSNLL